MQGWHTCNSQLVNLFTSITLVAWKSTGARKSRCIHVQHVIISYCTSFLDTVLQGFCWSYSSSIERGDSSLQRQKACPPSSVDDLADKCKSSPWDLTNPRACRTQSALLWYDIGKNQDSSLVYYRRSETASPTLQSLWHSERWLWTRAASAQQSLGGPKSQCPELTVHYHHSVLMIKARYKSGKICMISHILHQLCSVKNVGKVEKL